MIDNGRKTGQVHPSRLNLYRQEKICVTSDHLPATVRKKNIRDKSV